MSKSTVPKPVVASFCLQKRLPGIFLLTLFILTTFNVKSSWQEQKFTIRMDNSTLVKVFKEVERQSAFRFFYSAKIMEKARPVSINVRAADVAAVLAVTFKDQPFTYEIDNTSILVRPKSDAKTNPNSTPGRDTLIDVSGRVVSAKDGTPLPGATVKVEGAASGVTTDANGYFKVLMPSYHRLNISYVGFHPKAIGLPHDLDGSLFLISLEEQETALSGVEVVSTGYQTLPKERATGSFVQIDNALFNRKVGTNIMDRLEGIASGTLFNKNNSSRENESSISIRGRSTIFANPEPLIIVDNFPISGDINSINPNDVESITILKDAAAASIWGALAGNGVIVITTKKGNYHQPIKINFNSNLTVTEKPDQYYLPRLSSSSYLEYEQYLFEHGYYNGQENSSSRPVLSPGIEILIKERDNLLTADEANAALDKLRGMDMRREMDRYLYQKSVNQQYAVNLSGGSANQQFYFSAAYDRNCGNFIQNMDDRMTINGKNTYLLLKNKLELTTGLYFSTARVQSNGEYSNLYPYVQLADENGQHLAVPGNFRSPYLDTAGGGHLLDWQYRPLDDIGLNELRNQLIDYRLNVGLKYRVIDGLDVVVNYLFTSSQHNNSLYRDAQSFYVRDLVNQYSQVDFTTGSIIRPIPAAGILDLNGTRLRANNLRGNINFVHAFGDDLELVALGGAELKNQYSMMEGQRIYGYSKEMTVGTVVDLFNEFPLYYNGSQQKIPTVSSTTNNLYYYDRFVSYFGNASLTYKGKYILSGSARKDASNLFGVKSNQKGVPLWSVGGSWEMSKEPFYHVGWLPYLRFRVTDGYSGNVDNSLTALVTSGKYPNNIFNQSFQYIKTPPNPSLRWEKSQTFNAAVDFAAGQAKWIRGTLEYYIRKSTDLIGKTPIDPTSGFSSVTRNVANMRGEGIELSLQTQNINRAFKWSSNLNFSCVRNTVTDYFLERITMSSLFGRSITPVVGHPLYSIYSFRWAGLDENGDPQGYLDGKISKDYAAFNNNTSLNDLVFNGSATPIFFGNLMNNFSWKGFSLSVNLVAKLDYYFRRTALSYGSMLNGLTGVDEEYQQRWKQPGDEQRTNVPSVVYPLNSRRDIMYSNADIHIERGDHIRLQDIQAAYDFEQRTLRKAFKTLRVYGYVNNMGILWRKNKAGIDPDYVSSIYAPLAFSIGVQAGL